MRVEPGNAPVASICQIAHSLEVERKNNQMTATVSAIFMNVGIISSPRWP